MRFDIEPDGGKIINAACPICHLPIPLFQVTYTIEGIFRKQLKIQLEGDATDWVAHLWHHNQGMKNLYT